MVSLKVTEKLYGARPMTAAQKSKAKKRAKDCDKMDKKSEKLKIVLNEYESLIYSSNDFLEDEDVQQYLKSEDEKDKLKLYIDEELEWLSENGSQLEYDKVKAKFKVLEKKINPIKKRKSNRDIIPDEIDKAKSKLDSLEKSFKKYTKRKDWIPEEELEEFESILIEKREYLDEKLSQLKEIPLNEKLPFKKSHISAGTKEVADKCKYIIY